MFSFHENNNTLYCIKYSSFYQEENNANYLTLPSVNAADKKLKNMITFLLGHARKNEHPPRLPHTGMTNSLGFFLVSALAL